MSSYVPPPPQPSAPQGSVPGSSNGLPSPAVKQGLSTQAKLLIGCGVGALVAVVGMVGLFALLLTLGQSPKDFSVNVEHPWQVEVGETFEVVIHLTNHNEISRHVSDIDLDSAFSDSFLDGCVVVSSEPHLEEDSSMSGIKSFNYNQTIGPGESRTVTFTVEAQEVGSWGGTVTTYVGHRVAENNVNIVVERRSGGPVEKVGE